MLSQEVDEEIEEPEAAATLCAEERRRRPDLLDERLGRQFAEFRRRRAPKDVIRSTRALFLILSYCLRKNKCNEQPLSTGSRPTRARGATPRRRRRDPATRTIGLSLLCPSELSVILVLFTCHQWILWLKLNSMKLREQVDYCHILYNIVVNK